jgi:hypothetical protein
MPINAHVRFLCDREEQAQKTDEPFRIHIIA